MIDIIQLQVLNYILDSKNSSIIFDNNLDDKFFSDYKQEYNYIKSHLDTYGQIPDKETFLNKFKDFDLIKVNETPKFLIDELYRDYNQRFLATNFNEIRDLLLKGKTDEAMQFYINSSNLAVKANHIECVDILRDISRYNDYIERGNDFNKYYVKTGFKELDNFIGGWDRNEELATIVARSNVGKSWVLLKCALAAVEQGLKVGLYSGEMSERKVGYRLDTLISHISNSGIIKGYRDFQNVYKEYIDELPNRFTGSLKVLTPTMIDGPAGVTALRAFIEREELDILFIDQHSLLDDDRKARNPVEKASNISKDLKNLQVLKQIPIISVSQQNRSNTDNGTGLEHIAQADRIGQDSTVVIFLEHKDDEFTMTLVKSRDSANGKKLKYHINFDKGIFEYIPEETDVKEELLNNSGTKIEDEIVLEKDFF